MSLTKKKIRFVDSEEAIAIKSILILMTNDPTYNTGSTYSADLVTYPNGLIPFVDKHMNYISLHPGVDPSMYVKNLQLMSRYKA